VVSTIEMIAAVVVALLAARAAARHRAGGGVLLGFVRWYAGSCVTAASGFPAERI
jgi:hypothetical protein